MKKYILKIFLFSLIFYILDCGIFFIVREGYKKNNFGIEGKLNKLYYGNINEEVIILGNSRAASHFNPVVMENIYKKLTYNFGIGGAPVRDHYFILNKIIERGFKPSSVIYNVGINTLGEEEPGVWGFHYIEHQPYYVEDNMLKNIIRAQGYRYYIKTLCKCYAYNRVFVESIKNFFRTTCSEEAYIKGADILDIPWDGKFEEFKRKNPNGYICKIDKRPVEYFFKIIKLTKAHNIKLILVKSPEYYEIYKMQNNRKEVFSFIEKIAKENSLIFLDYGDEKCYLSKSRKYFFNS